MKGCTGAAALFRETRDYACKRTSKATARLLQLDPGKRKLLMH